MLDNRLTYVDFALDLGYQKFSVVRYSGVEEISRLFRFEVTLASDDSAIAFDDVVGRGATLEFGFNEGKTVERQVHGVVSEFEHCGGWENWGRYRATIVPKLWRATLGRRCAIHPHCRADDVVKEVLTGYGVAATCPSAEQTVKYIIQYDESDWDFVQRLLEAHGFCYYFEHSASDHKLVILDGLGFPTIGGESTLVYRPDAGALISTERSSVEKFAVRESPLATDVERRDYNFSCGREPIEGSDNRGEVRFDHPWTATEAGFAELGGVIPSAVGAAWGSSVATSRSAKVRMEQLDWQRRTARGQAACYRLCAGHSFKLEEHPSDDANAEWVIYRVEHEGSQEAGAGEGASPTSHTSRFWCFESGRPYRPLERTPKRRIWGTQTATVTQNPSSDLDAAGTVTVKVHWPQAENDEIAIPGVPVSQLFAGPFHGAMFHPRIDEEVLLEFLGGDPERPVIVGRIYDGTNLPPYDLPAEVSKSTIKSLSYREGSYGEGFNELTFEDKEDGEEIYLHGQKDWRIEIEEDKAQTIGRNETLEVEKDRDKTIHGNQSEMVDGNQTIDVGGDHTEAISGSQTVTVTRDRTLSVKGSLSEEVVGSQTSKVAGSQSLSVQGPATHQFAGTKQEQVTGLLRQSVTGTKVISVVGSEVHEVNGGPLQTTVVGSRADMVTGSQSILVTGSYTLLAGGAAITVSSSGDISINGGKITITGSGDIAVSGSKLAVKSDGEVSVEASGAVKVKGSAVDIN